MSDSAAAHMEAVWEAPTVYRPDLFAGQVAMVSGGGSGIGRSVALLLARLGARVVICGRTSEKLEGVVAFARARGVEMRALACNIREVDQVDALFREIGDSEPRLDILVNSAGGQFPQAAIDFAPKGWLAVINNNLNGTWFMMQKAAQYWRDRQQPGCIANVIVVTERGMPGVAHSVAARAGIIGATRTVAVEWAPLQIRVNCLAPGLTATEGLDVYPEQARAEFPKANPLRRPARPMEIAEACVFLVTPASSFMTGEVMTVDGGGKLWGELWLTGRPEYYSFPAS